MTTADFKPEEYEYSDEVPLDRYEEVPWETDTGYFGTLDRRNQTIMILLFACAFTIMFSIGFPGIIEVITTKGISLPASDKYPDLIKMGLVMALFLASLHFQFKGMHLFHRKRPLDGIRLHG